MTLPAVLVTGGARRVGAAIVRAFAEAGWHVVIHHRHAHDEAEALTASLPSAETIACELTDTAAAIAMIRTLVARLPGLTTLVNSAAVFSYDGPEALAPATFTEAMRVNALAPAAMAQAFLAAPRAQNAASRRVIQITDMKLANPNPDFFSYTMAKHALAATVPMLAIAIREHRLGAPDDRVYGLAPGAMLASFDQREDEHQSSGRMNLLGRLTAPEELAEAAIYLAGGWLANGETLFIDSGQHLLAQPRDVLYLARQRQDGL